MQSQLKAVITESPESFSSTADPIMLDSIRLGDLFEDRFDFPDFADDRDRLDRPDFPDFPDLPDRLDLTL